MLTAAALVLLTLPAHQTFRAENDIARGVREWIQAAREHQAGTIDRPLLLVARMAPEQIDLVRHHLRAVIKVDLSSAGARNQLLRRGAVLHTDIALLLPQQAATFTQADLPTAIDPYSGRVPVRREADALVFSADGEFMAATEESAHWWMARLLLTWLLPHPSVDPFVPLWYRATVAHFESAGLFGNAKYQLSHALDILPRDPVLLFYAGAMHEAYAGPAIQSIPLTRAAREKRIRMPLREDAWREAARLFRQSADAGGPVEARVRLGRVLGCLGRHADAADVLRRVRPEVHEPRLQYLTTLFLGTEEGALDRVAAAREALDHAAALFPSAQAPLMALSELHHRTGDRAAALDALRRLGARPGSPDEWVDPWREYHLSFAADHEARMSAMREAVLKPSR